MRFIFYFFYFYIINKIILINRVPLPTIPELMKNELTLLKESWLKLNKLSECKPSRQPLTVKEFKDKTGNSGLSENKDFICPLSMSCLSKLNNLKFCLKMLLLVYRLVRVSRMCTVFKDRLEMNGCIYNTYFFIYLELLWKLLYIISWILTKLY